MKASKDRLVDKLVDSLVNLSDADELIIAQFNISYPHDHYIVPEKIGTSMIAVDVHLNLFIKRLSEEIGCEYNEVTTRMRELGLLR